MELSDLAIPQLSTDAARDKLVRDLLQRAYTDGTNAARDQAVVNAWKQFTGLDFVRYTPTSTYLRGFPGQGKTTAYISAAYTVANLLGMNVIMQPERPVPVTQNDLVIAIINLSGEVSNLAVSGVPKIDSQEGASLDFTRRVPPFALTAAAQAGVSVVVFDDMPNASPNIQNVANDMLDRGRAQGLDLGPHALVGATGNLGAIDATAVSSTSTATATRVNNYIVQDHLDDWCERVKQQYPDRIGDAGITEFLKTNPDLFHKPTRKRHGEPYPTPRSWSRALEEHIRPLYAIGAQMIDRNVSPGDIDSLITQHTTLAAGLIGIEAGDKLATHYRTLLNDSLPLAREVLNHGKLTKHGEDRFASLYGDGVSAEAETFLNQFTGALCEEAAVRLVESYSRNPGEFEKSVKSLMTGLYNYSKNTSHLGWAGHYLVTRLIRIANDPNIGTIEPKSGVPIINSEFAAHFVRAVNGHPEACRPVESGRTLFEETMLPDMLGHDAHTLGALQENIPKPVSASAANMSAPGM